MQNRGFCTTAEGSGSGRILSPPGEIGGRALPSHSWGHSLRNEKMYAGAGLSSRDPAVQVLWALMSLTSVFGMGTGVSSPSLAPAHLYSTPFGLYYLGYLFSYPGFLFLLLVVTRMGIEPMLPA